MFDREEIVLLCVTHLLTSCNYYGFNAARMSLDAALKHYMLWKRVMWIYRYIYNTITGRNGYAHHPCLDVCYQF